MKTPTTFALACLLGTTMPASHGICLSDVLPLAEEFAQTTVVVARVESAHEVQDDPDDPAGISATLYTVMVLERLRGTSARMLELRSDNTSSRFPMERGRHYLLFVHTAHDGSRYIDACGHSGELPRSRSMLVRARKLAGNRP